MSLVRDDAVPSTRSALSTPSWLQYSTVPFRRLLKLPFEVAEFEARGFTTSDPSKRQSLEIIGRTFVEGYNAALSANDVADVLWHISAVPPAQRGFAAEGLAMGLAVADCLPFRNSWLASYLRLIEHDFTYLAHVGAGWALACVPWRHRQILAPLDPIHRWLAFDGLGFHDTYFQHHRILTGWRREQSGYAVHAYDQGVGRALWFVTGGSPEGAISLISKFPTTRQSDLWSGLGLAMAYAGPSTAKEIAAALQSAEANGSSFAQGIAFACEARAIADHVPSYTDLAGRAVWDASADALSALVREARGRLGATEGDPPRYELWRRSVADAFLTVAGRRG